MTNVGDLKDCAVRSAAYDTVLQVSMRVVSFMVNAAVVRSVGAATFAVCSVRLLLLYSTTLLLSREAFRRAALTARSHTHNYKLVNLLWGSSVSVVAVGCLLGWVWWGVMATPPTSVVPEQWHYTAAVVLVLLCCVVEVFAEAPHVLAELHMWCKTKVVIEGVMQVVRSVLVAVVVTWYPGYTILGYGLCHLAGSCVYTAAYFLLFYRAFKNKEDVKKLPVASMRHLFPIWDKSGSWLPPVEPQLWGVARGFVVQCWLKQVLTEGEWLLMNFLPLVSLTHQGYYQVVHNLGSLGVRLVFRGVEAASYRFFAQTLQRGVALPLQDQSRVRAAREALEALLRGLAITGLLVLSFGWPYSHLLLHLYGGAELASAGGGLMRAQCVLVAVLALNGATEAYTFAVMAPHQLHRHSALLVVFSVVYLAAAAFLSSRLGAVGFILANCANMGLRITHGWWFIHNQYACTPHRPLNALLLPPPLLLKFCLAWAVTAASERLVYPHSAVGHVGVGVVTLAVLLWCLRFEFRPLYTLALRKLDTLSTKAFSLRRVDQLTSKARQLAPTCVNEADCTSEKEITTDTSDHSNMLKNSESKTTKATDESKDVNEEERTEEQCRKSDYSVDNLKKDNNVLFEYNINREIQRDEVEILRRRICEKENSSKRDDDNCEGSQNNTSDAAAQVINKNDAGIYFDNIYIRKIYNILYGKTCSIVKTD